MLVRNAADELGQFGVRVNAIRPGLVPTDASSVLDGDEATRQDYLDQMPLGHTGETSDIGAAVRYLVGRSEEPTSEPQSLMRNTYAVISLEKHNTRIYSPETTRI